MNNPLVSIIIPVFNAEKYLCQCLDSVAAQTYTNWECLLVDDGSQDTSGAICDEFATKDSRFKVFHKENGGVSSARNIGIDNANGIFAMFIDADDIISSNALETLVVHFSDNIDLVQGGFNKIDENGLTIDDSAVCIKDNKRLSVEGNVLLFYEHESGRDWQRYLWNRLLKLSIIKKNNIRFDNNIYYKEDGLFLIQYMMRQTKDVFYTNNIVYHYRQNRESAMGGGNIKFSSKLLTNITAHSAIINAIKKRKLSQKVIREAEIAMIDSYYWIVNAMRKSKNYHISIRFTLLCQILQTISLKTFYRYQKERLYRLIKRI